MKNFVQENLFKLLPWLLSGILTTALLFGDSRWTKSDLFSARIKPLECLPARVDNLDQWRMEQRYAQQQDAAQFATLKDKLASLEGQIAVNNALLLESAKQQDRILRILDRRNGNEQ